MQKTALAAAAALGLMSGAAHAASITYDLVNQNVDGVETSGSITTNGTIGVLGTNDITGFNITLTQAGLGTLYLTSSSATETVIGGDLSATKTGLSWNYAGGTGAEFSVVTKASPNTLAQFHFYTDRTDVDFGTVEHVLYQSGVQQVGTLSTVPLPASAPMFGAALVALGMVGYGLNRKSKAAA